MSAALLLRDFVRQRLSAAAEEIFQQFERTIEKYEEEARSSTEEIKRLRVLLQEATADASQSFPSEEDPAFEHHLEQEPRLSVHQRAPELRHIKVEVREIWTTEDEEEEQVEEFKAVGSLNLPHSAAREKHEQEETQLCWQRGTENSEREEQLKELRREENSHVGSQILNEIIPNDREHVGSVVNVMANHNQDSTSTYRNSELSDSIPVSSWCHCYRCGKSFASHQHLINHALHVHSKDADHVCAVCGTSVDSAQNLGIHLKSHKGSRCCLVCGKNCKSATALGEHMSSHTGVKLHRCHICGKQCSRKGDLKVHLRIHTGEKPFSCSHCRKSFTHSGHLKKHMRSHTGERPHQCNICGKGYLQSTHLKHHLATHTRKC